MPDNIFNKLTRLHFLLCVAKRVEAYIITAGWIWPSN